MLFFEVREDHEAPLPLVSTNANDGEKWYKEPLSVCKRINSANILRQRGGVMAYAATRINDSRASAFFLIFDSSMFQVILRKTNKQWKRKNCRELHLKELHNFFGLCIFRLHCSLLQQNKWWI